MVLPMHNPNEQPDEATGRWCWHHAYFSMTWAVAVYQLQFVGKGVKDHRNWGLGRVARLDNKGIHCLTMQRISLIHEQGIMRQVTKLQNSLMKQIESCLVALNLRRNADSSRSR